jgi:nicotinamidase/pyrazinamidase
MRALLLVDIQNDFMPGGALPVDEGDQIVAIVNSLMEQFDLIIAVRDWHPPGHHSFASHHGKEPGELVELAGLEQILWPDHCVQHSAGAQFVPELRTEKIAVVFDKGIDPSVDSYGGFYDNGRRRATGLADYLKQRDVDHLYVVGLATDYCVKATVLDALELGFKVSVVLEGVRAVEVAAGDGQRALEEMEQAGAQLIQAEEVSQHT